MASRVEDRVGPSKLPFGPLRLLAFTVLRTSSRLSPAAASAAGLARIRTAGRWPPLMLTRPTPEICEIFCARRVSTRSWICGSGMLSDITARVRIGASAGFTLLNTGWFGRSLGSRLCALLIAACTSCSATSRLLSRLNCRVITEAPPELVEDISLSPGICPSWFSSGAVTEEVMISGLAPG
ncbi:hypothetical protein D9M71_187300 [compost metagenome]